LTDNDADQSPYNKPVL